MRINPDAVYLELETVTLVSRNGGVPRYVPAVRLHFKEGNRWQKRIFAANEDNGETLGAILARLGEWIDHAGGLQAALDEVTSELPLA